MNLKKTADPTNFCDGATYKWFFIDLFLLMAVVLRSLCEMFLHMRTLGMVKYLYHKKAGPALTEVHWVKRLRINLPEMSKFTI